MTQVSAGQEGQTLADAIRGISTYVDAFPFDASQLNLDILN